MRIEDLMVVSQSTTPESMIDGAGIIDQLRKEGEIPEEAIIYIPPDKYNPEPKPSGVDDWDDEVW